MALPYQSNPVPTVPQSDNLDQWRVKTNSAIERTNNQEVKIGDLNELAQGEESLVDAVNGARDFSIAITLALA